MEGAETLGAELSKNAIFLFEPDESLIGSTGFDGLGEGTVSTETVSPPEEEVHRSTGAGEPAASLTASARLSRRPSSESGTSASP